MLKAYSVVSDLNKDACEIIKTAGVQLEITNSNERPDKEKLTELFNRYDILIIGAKEKFTKDMLSGINSKKIIATLSVGLDIDTEDYKELLRKKRNNVIVTPHIAGNTVEAVKRMDIELAKNIKEYLIR